MMRWFALALGFLVLLWLPVEDVDLRMVVILAALIGAWTVLRVFKGVLSLRKNILVWHMIAGLTGGAAVSPIAIGLMVIKTGLHSHEAPDFTLGQIRTIAALIPIWSLAGSFVGLGTGLLRLVVAERPPHDYQIK